MPGEGDAPRCLALVRRFCEVLRLSWWVANDIDNDRCRFGFEPVLGIEYAVIIPTVWEIGFVVDGGGLILGNDGAIGHGLWEMCGRSYDSDGRVSGRRIMPGKIGCFSVGVCGCGEGHGL